MSVESIIGRLAAVLREMSMRLAFAAMPRMAAGVLAIEARALGAAAIPHLFASDLQRLSPTLNDDLLELYGRSEQALANRFGFFGQTEEFAGEINWEPPRGGAWRTELHAFDYALDLALTFRISGDERYARHLRYLLAAWIASNRPGRSIGWAPLVLARRIRNWILAADLCRGVFEPDGEFLGVLTASLAQQVTYLAWQVRSIRDRRARLTASRTLLLARRMFSGHRSASLGRISSALLAEALSDGTASFADHPQPLRQFELASACADHILLRAGSVSPAPVADVRPSQTLTRSAVADHPLPEGEGLAPRLNSSPLPQGEGGERSESGEVSRSGFQLALEELEGMLHPDGTIPLFGREPLPLPDAVATLAALGAAVLGVPRWKDLAGGELGILPYMLLGESGKRRFADLPHEPWRAESRLKSESGIYRIGDGKSSAMLINGTPMNSPHGHRDLFSYELAVNGQRTVVDSGIAAPTAGVEADDLAGATCHNVLLVDGRPPAVGATSEARVSPVEGQARVCGLWLAGNWSSGHPLAGQEKSGPSPILHQRGYFLIAERYWVVLDYLTGMGARQVESLVHFYPTFSLEVREGSVLARSGAASVSVQPMAASEHGVDCRARLRTDRNGWYAPALGNKHPCSTLTLEWEQVVLPGAFGYVIDTNVLEQRTECAIGLSRTEIRLTCGRMELPFKLP